jgi:hypothetical protein
MGERKKSELTLDSYQDVVSFARHLAEDKGWTAMELIHFLEKPWKWGEEFRAWAESINGEGGKPRP